MRLHFWIILFCTTLLLATGCDKNDGVADQGSSKVDLAQGEKVYGQRCAACHDRGLAGAPQTGNKREWTTAITQGIDVMIEHSLNGYKGQRGLMPARGGHADLSDSDVTAAVHYIVQKSR